MLCSPGDRIACLQRRSMKARTRKAVQGMRGKTVTHQVGEVVGGYVKRGGRRA